jgi:O-antigen/teichoic acid export membrane protein
VGVVLTGAAAAQAIPLVGAVAIARIYAPGEYGVFATWLGVVSLAGVVVTGRFEVALALEPDGEPRREAVAATLATVALGCATLLLLVGLAALGPWRLPHPTLWVAGVPAVAVTAVAQTWQAWASAEGRYRDLSIMRIAQAALVTGGAIAAGLSRPSALSLAIAQTAGVGCGLAVSAWRLPLSPGSRPAGGWRAAVAAFWSRRRRFPMLSVPADSVNNAAAQLPLLVVTSRFGAEVAGWLALAMRMLGAPISLLGAAVLEVFRRHAAQGWRERGECREEYLRTLKVLGAGSVAVVLVFAPFSELLFAAVFGERWRMAGTIARWMLPMFAMRFVASPLSYMFYVAEKQHVDLVWQVSLLAMTAATLMLPGGYAAALLSYSAGYGLLYVVYLVLSYRFSRGVNA